jgi:hypothetical protein
MKHEISKRERAKLTIAGAQTLAGRGKTPSARQVRKAHDAAGSAVAEKGIRVHGGADSVDHLVDGICGTLSGIGGETSDECGSFWSRVKDAATSIAPLAPLFGPTATVTVPIARGIASKMSPKPASHDDDLQSITGFGPERTKVEDYEYIFGEPLTDEELVSGEGGSGAAMWYRTRRRAPAPMAAAANRYRALIVGADHVPHDIYRAAILQRARKISNRGAPTARNMRDAQASVDKDLRSLRVGVAIPGAQPGRVTR